MLLLEKLLVKSHMKGIDLTFLSTHEFDDILRTSLLTDLMEKMRTADLSYEIGDNRQKENGATINYAKALKYKTLPEEGETRKLL